MEQGHAPHASGRAGEVTIHVTDGQDVAWLVGDVIRRVHRAQEAARLQNGGIVKVATWVAT